MKNPLHQRPDENVYTILDYETRSEADLKKRGAYEYANDPSTKILCAAWRTGTREELWEQLRQKMEWQAENLTAPWYENPHRAKCWSPAFPDEWESDVDLAVQMFAEDVILVAHNALFEQVITRFVFARRNFIPPMRRVLASLPHDRWVCTAALASALAVPRNLEGACLALKIAIEKDMDGRRLMMKYCKPRKVSKNNQNKWHNSARDLRRIVQYCGTDVDAETLLFLTAPPLNETERKVWLLDQKINFKGFAVDREMVNQTLKMISTETVRLNEETRKMTNGRPGSTTQRDGVLQWLHDQGVFLPDLRAKTVADALAEGVVEGDAKRLLEIRQAVSKTSTKKYHAFDARSRTDGRVRDILIYHTASTGRWGGSGVQPQNFPRGMAGVDTTLAADFLKSGDLELIRMLYGDPMDVFSSCLRSVIVAPKGRELFCADYAAIEARVLFWVAKHVAGLKSFVEDRPMYEEMAMVIYSLELIEQVTKAQRQVGKQSFLGCGYGMGWKKFLQTCKFFGMEVDEETAQKAVYAYRNIHEPVVKLWSNLEKAAIAATERKGTKFKINRTTWWVSPLPGTKLDFLWCELPSGRRLSYPGPIVKYELTPWEEKRPVLYHWGVNGLTRKWELSGTYGGKLTENVVQAISRDLLADSLLRTDETRYETIMHVHDEIVAERDLAKGSVAEFEALMATTPVWAEGCPVKVAGWKGPRYHK